MTISNNKTTYLISSQLPQFVVEDHETFVQFLEEYYKFLAKDGEVEYVAKNFTNYMDIDILTEHIGLTHPNLADYKDYHAFLQKMYDSFIRLIPSKVLSDKSLILKHAKDFYRARGSEKSVRFLLRILLNKEIDFYYPKRDILKASDGKWYIEKSIKIGNIQVDNSSNVIAATNFAAKTIRGNTSNATATVEFVDTYFDKGQLVTELKISNSIKSFINGEKVFAYYTEEGNQKFLSGTLFSGIISSVTLIDGGIGYIAGSSIPVEGGGGSGASVIVSKVTQGSIATLGIVKTGAGFKGNDNIIVLGGGGSGANAKVFSVDVSEKYHPNSYNVISTQISLEANTPIGNSVYSNLVPSLSDPANAWVSNSMSAWTFSNCGPISAVSTVSGGNNYTSIPIFDVQSNTVIRSLGILGHMEIVNGGLNYQIGDKIEFKNKIGSLGQGASGNVTNVAANGKITEIKFEGLPGHFVGGSGYRQDLLPLANVVTTTGNGANIVVMAILADGEELISSTTSIGTITEIKILDGGSGYSSPPVLNLANMAFGSNAVANASIVSGVYTYPGRYLNDDGQVSSYNFLEDRDYYQNYSYVIKINESVNKYRKPIKDLIHPAGMKMFGEYTFKTNTSIDVDIAADPISSNDKMFLSSYFVHTSDVTKSGSYNVKTLTGTYNPYIGSATFNVKPSVAATYDSRNKKIYAYSFQHSYRLNDFVYLSFETGYANIVNGLYVITMANTNYFSVDVKNGNTSFVALPPNTSNLTVDTGSGNTVSFINLSQWISNSNVTFTTGDSLNIQGNVVTVVYSTANSNTIAVFPAISGNLIANNVVVIREPFNAKGNVTIYNPVVRVSYSDIRQSSNSNVYLEFKTSDTSYSNGTYNVKTSTFTQFTVLHNDIANASILNGNVSVYSNSVVITSNSHGLVEGESVYLTFTSGDMLNVTNSFYNVKSVTANTFNVNQSNTVMSGGNVSVKTANVTLTITDHGFTTNDFVHMWFTSGDTANLSNGVYKVFVRDINTLYITSRKQISSNGNLTVYRNYMNVTINKTDHGYNDTDNVRIMLETGNLINVSNGIYIVNNVANTNTYNILHDSITVSSNLDNLLSNGTGYVYVSGV